MIKNINLKINRKKGFTLIEVVVAMGIFTIIMGGSAGAFANAFKSYKGAKNINENLKNAQYAMNLMAKTFRTSSIASANSSTATQIVIYDHSRPSNKCIRYSFSGNSLYESKINVAAPTIDQGITNCENVTPATFNSSEGIMTTGTVTGLFNVTNSAGVDSGPSSTRVGNVTVMMNITNSGGGNSSSARIQSTSSLRDYTVSNLGIDPNNDPN